MNTTYHMPHEWLNRPVNIVLAGCGGTGSEMLDEIFRIHSLLIALEGHGFNVHVFDPDDVSMANIGRQRFLPCDIGHPKAEVLISRLNSFAGTQWHYHNQRYEADQDSISFDLLITCVDTPTLRAEIGMTKDPSSVNDPYEFGFGGGKEVLWLDCGNDSHSGNVILGHLNNGKSRIELPNVFDLYPMLATMEHTDEPSCSTAEALTRQDYGINRSVAREAANLLWQLFRNGQLKHHGSYIDIRQGCVSPLQIDEKVWSAFRQSA